MRISELIINKSLDLTKIKTKEDLILLMGLPSDTGKSGRNSFVYKYKNWEFSYSQNSLTLIAVYNETETRELDGEEQIWGMSIKQFLDYLNNLNVDWEYDKYYPQSEDQAKINLSSDSIVILDPMEDRVWAIMKEVVWTSPH